MNGVTEADLERAAEASELLAEELIERGQQMLSLGRRLLAQVDDLNAAASGMEVQPTPLEEERSVGKRGAVTIHDAIHHAKTMGTFTRKEFEEATGLSAGASMKWLARLVNNRPPILELVVQGSRGRASLYQYIPIEGESPRERPEHASAVDRAAGVGADRQATGEAVPYTGGPIGTSGKPGLDKARSKHRKVVRGKGKTPLGGGRR